MGRDGIDEPDNQYPFIEKRSADHEKRLSLMEQAVISLKSTNEGLTTKMDLILAQLTKVALLEERHLTQQLDVNRAHERIGKAETKLEAHVTKTDEFMAYTKGVSRVLWTLGGAVALLAIKVLFFAASHGMPTP